MMSIPTLHTERLTLRPMTMDDAPRLVEISSTEEAYRYTLNIPRPYELHHATEWIALHESDFDSKTSVVWGITLTESGLVIGTMGLGFAGRHQRGELGYNIAVDYWNQGFCTEAVRAVINYAFNDLQLHKVAAQYTTGNDASGRVMLKAGMTQEGILKEHFEKDGEFRDAVVYGILNPNH